MLGPGLNIEVDMDADKAVQLLAAALLMAHAWADMAVLYIKEERDEEEVREYKLILESAGRALVKVKEDLVEMSKTVRELKKVV